MQFLINEASFFYREEEEGVFSLMNLKTNQVFTFLRPGKLLLKHAGKWTDFDGFVQSIHTRMPQQKLRRLFSSMLFELHAGGLAQLKDVPRGNYTGIRVADKNDYYHLSEFCRKNSAAGLSCCRVVAGSYYGFSGMYERLKKQEEMILMEEQEGVIRSVLITGISKRFFGGNVPELISFIFDETMTEKECTVRIIKLSDAACAELGKAWPKVRYEYINPRQDFVVRVLQENGFEKTACFEAEISGKGTLLLYDKQI